MKQNLGRIILILLLITINIFANGVEVILDKPAIYKNDQVSFTIKASGDNVKFPNIKNIDGYRIEGVSKSSSTSIINGDISKSVSQIYTFSPLKSVEIPSFNVEIDGKEYKTQSKKVSVLKPTKSKKGDNFIVELSTDKNKLYVGESTILNISFKQKIDAQADKLNLNKPELSDFWMKKIKDSKQYTEGEYIVQTFKYLIFPQKDGNLTINSVEADIGKIVRNNNSMFNDPFFSSFSNQIRWAKIYSNSLNIEVKPLPNNLELYGKFSIKASVDKKEVIANKPVNLTISVDGIGNIDDIKKFDLNVDGAIVYSDNPKTSSSLNGNQYQGKFTQKVAIIGGKNFTIPPIELSYFDRATKKVKTIKTKPINIIVKGGTISKPAKIETQISSERLKNIKPKIIYKNENSNLKYIFFIIGTILGVIGSYIYFTKFKIEKDKKESDITKKIKSIKDDRELFNLLLPYAKDSIVVSKILKDLEENIYKKANHIIDKQKLYDYFL